ncbi:MAG TPA: hypothetical protein VKE22_01665 [Haliangiales bacterium]|nr:hypothetical protein [Haliangiales bacterium]
MKLWVALLLCASSALADERAALQAEARTILGKYCGRCHDSDSATAKPAALAIFDLKDKGWFNHLTKDRLSHILNRMDSFGVPAPEQVRIKAFVAAELAARP